MRRTKYVGFLTMCLGALLMVGAAVMPVGPATQRLEPFHVPFSGENCGPAGYVAFHRPNTDCGTAAAKRLEVSTPIGLLVLALGMAMFAGGDERRGSRIDVASPRLTRQARAHSRGRKRYIPG
ncbi:MAG TPA: hypothetical protein VHT97_05990 [Acidimicrobiales bacterium]|nr:hypothetical protein [Acidimicrobiales bacterium]